MGSSLLSRVGSLLEAPLTSAEVRGDVSYPRGLSGQGFGLILSIPPSGRNASRPSPEAAFLSTRGARCVRTISMPSVVRYVPRVASQ